MNAMNTLTRPGTSDNHDPGDPHGTDAVQEQPPAQQKPRGLRDADGMAVASFVLGLAGLLVFNIVLGPCALVLGGLALTRGTARRGRALLGITLGAADLIVLAAVVTASGSSVWSVTG